jgi:hypothetical protein
MGIEFLFTADADGCVRPFSAMGRGEICNVRGLKPVGRGLLLPGRAEISNLTEQFV